MNSGIHTFREIPTEIENYIFLWTARLWIQWYPTGISGLTVVSKRVQSIVEPVLYETVVHRCNESSSGGFISTNLELAFDNRPTSFFSSHVKNLYICSRSSETFALRMLEACAGVDNLFYGAEEHGSVVPLIVHLPLRSLSAHISLLESFPQIVHNPESIFPNLKYLSLTIAWDHGNDLLTLSWLPALTHLRLMPTRYREKEVKRDIKKVLFTIAALEMIVICVEDWTINYEKTRGLRRKWMKLDPRVRVEDWAPSNWMGFVRGGEFFVDSDDEELDSD